MRIVGQAEPRAKASHGTASVCEESFRKGLASLESLHREIVLERLGDRVTALARLDAFLGEQLDLCAPEKRSGQPNR
jgi:hypothetical protein